MRSFPFLLLLLFTGCKSLFYHEVPHKILIESDPPGARIELNEEYIGDTPLEYTLLGGHKRQFSENHPLYIFRASPTAAVGYVQTKVFHSRDPRVDSIPKHLFFDLRLHAADNKDVDLHLDIKAHESK